MCDIGTCRHSARGFVCNQAAVRLPRAKLENRGNVNPSATCTHEQTHARAQHLGRVRARSEPTNMTVESTPVGSASSALAHTRPVRRLDALCRRERARVVVNIVGVLRAASRDVSVLVRKRENLSAWDAEEEARRRIRRNTRRLMLLYRLEYVDGRRPPWDHRRRSHTLACSQGAYSSTECLRRLQPRAHLCQPA